MVIKEVSPITLSDELCSRCLICRSVCPFEAISLNQDRVVIDIEKCMLCGICASVCPSAAIKPYYYGYEVLIKGVEARKMADTASLVVACRGSTAADDQLVNTLDELKVKSPIVIRVPCVGRLPSIFYLGALSRGIRRIVAIQCSQAFCRFNKGSVINHRRVAMLRSMLKCFGYEDDTVTIIERTRQIGYDTAKCVGCDKCVYACPYKAIQAQSLATPKVDYEKCTGCGACAVVCPHLALEIDGYECLRMAELVQSYGKQLKKGRSPSPSILVFCCKWAEFTGLDQNQSRFLRSNVALLEIPCFSKLDPLNVFQAFQCGFDGVLVVACSDGDCKSKESRVIAQDNVRVLEAGLKIMGLENRFKVHKTSPRKLGDFDNQLDSFAKTVLALKGG